MEFSVKNKNLLIQNLVEIQQQSFNELLCVGLKRQLLQLNFIENKTRNIKLIFHAKNYKFILPEITPKEAVLKSKTFASALFIPVEYRAKNSIGLYWVLLGHLPFMTKRGHFIINGVPRVVLNQMVRSPGLYYKTTANPQNVSNQVSINDSSHTSPVFYSDIIPNRGTWLRLEIDRKKNIWIRMKRVDKIPMMLFLQALGYDLHCIEKLLYSRKFLNCDYLLNTDHPADSNSALKKIKVEIEQQKVLKLAALEALDDDDPDIAKQLDYIEKTTTPEMGKDFLFQSFFNPASYDLSPIGRFQLNKKLNLSIPSDYTVLTEFDIYFATKELIKRATTMSNSDDIDHLQTRRIRSCGELLEIQLGEGIERLQKTIIDKINNTNLKKFAKHSSTYKRGTSSSIYRQDRQVINTDKNSKFLKNNLPTKFNRITLEPNLLPNGTSFIHKNNKLNQVSSNKLKLLSKKLIYLNLLINQKFIIAKLKSANLLANKSSFDKFLIHLVDESPRQKFVKNKTGLYHKFIPTPEIYIVEPNLNLVDMKSQQKFNLLKMDLYKVGLAESFLKSNLNNLNIYLQMCLRKPNTYFRDISKICSAQITQQLKQKSFLKLLLINPRLISQNNLLVLNRAVNFLKKIQFNLKDSPNLNDYQNFEINKLKAHIFKCQIKTQNNLTCCKYIYIKTKFNYINLPIKQFFFTKRFLITEQKLLLGGKFINSNLALTSLLKLHKFSEVVSNSFLIYNANNPNPNPTSIMSMIRPVNKSEIYRQLNRRFVRSRLQLNVLKSELTNSHSQLIKANNDPIDRELSIQILKQDVQKSNPFNKKGIYNQRFINKKFLDTSQFIDQELLHFLKTHKIFLDRQLTSLKTKQQNEKLKFIKWKKLRNFKNALKNPIQNLITTNAINGALQELFGLNPLSQFMDQINPLSEITHKRRISSMGPGGVNRDNASMDVRSIHPTHYGRICPIETPEGHNAGLVNSPTIYARINNYGFLETPFFKVNSGQIQAKAFYLNAQKEQKFKVSPPDLSCSELQFLPLGPTKIESEVPMRKDFKFQRMAATQIEFIGISPLQMISVATSLIPFLEHDDANRALMGSNMQRQAVPLLIAERPVVGTGLEGRVIADSSYIMQTKQSGVISYVSNEQVIVQTFHLNN
uniref:DNA-directed RNA polymerase subunit beta N-terminal section n=1 Tax=Pleurastrum terricola TaxID=34116 RepID=RPOB1_PLETE|nr:RNA polymerase beta chain [Pleurastrum terricola]A6YGD9.1 RecName: Full=DNA-directed RNA polymerase subunit beta N-terminal section; AltName: Full=PEP; AltName: Full=Plastid-encoded RNA polymerase subunit beta N-terminal section; Short=RNA polymerase subunit beta N-terminal section [Pleurastrum terricola]ABO69351.1 RNA polymerase beta chain [Pleurastrum terricola]